MDKKMFTISVFTENRVGILNRVSVIFTRRGINLESVSSSPSAEAGVHKMNFLVSGDYEVLRKVVDQIE